MMSDPIHAFSFLESKQSQTPASVCVVFGDDSFLRKLVVAKLKKALLGAAQKDSPHATFQGESTQWRDIADELFTVSLFGGDRRLVVVEDADSFVTSFRSRLEDYVANPSTASTLILVVHSWPSNTRLYKSILKRGLTLECKVPEKSAGRRKETDFPAVVDFLVQRTEQCHQAKLTAPAANLLLELVGFEFGLLDQELAKLSLFVAEGGEIERDLVSRVVGGWKTKTIWDLLDYATMGKSADAIRELDRLLFSGEPIQAMFGAISWSLRRFADATRIIEGMERRRERVNMRGALEQAGFRNWPHGALENAERQLRKIGRHRAGRIHEWLLEADLSLKSTHAAPDRARLVIEKLILRLAR